VPAAAHACNVAVTSNDYLGSNTEIQQHVMKFIIVFLYSMTLTAVLWLSMHADTWWTWALLAPVIALGVALSLMGLPSLSAALGQYVSRIVEDRRHLWRRRS
jgi:hypothetical protein